MNYYTDALKKYAVFSGRARRKEFWIFFIPNIIVYIAWQWMFMIDDSTNGNVYKIAFWIFCLYALCFLLPSIAVLVRRLHDTNRSAWWLLIDLVPLVGTIVLVVFAATDSWPGENRYGTNPKEHNIQVISEPKPQANEQRAPLALRVTTIIFCVLSFLGSIPCIFAALIPLMFCDSGPVSACIAASCACLLIWLLLTSLGVFSLILMNKKPKIAFSLSLIAVLLCCAGYLFALPYLK